LPYIHTSEILPVMQVVKTNNKKIDHKGHLRQEVAATVL